jgi:hypothetical protein
MATSSVAFPGRATLLILLAFIALLPAVTTRLNASDEIEFFAWLRSWAFDRDIDFDNEYRHFYELAPEKHGGFKQTFLDDTNEAGRRPNFAPIGSALLWAPFYAVGHAVARVSGAAVDGYSQPYVSAVAYGSAYYGLAALLLSAAIARRLLGQNGIGAAAAIAVGTPLLFYMYVAPGFSHACSAFAVALFLWLWLRVRTRWSMAGVATLGAVGGLLPMVREQDLFFLAGPALDFLYSIWRSRRTGPASEGWPATTGLRIATGLFACLLVYSPQLMAYQALNGHPSPTTDVARKMTWTSPHFLSVLFSPEHGLFFWTPLALVALGGLAWFTIRRHADSTPDGRWVGGLMLLMFTLQVYVSGSVESWTVAGAFGQRRFVALTPLLVVGLAALVPLLRHGRRRAWLCTGGLLLGIWWNIGLMAQFGLHQMDRQRLSLSANARWTFVEFPRAAPALTWRYLTNRESFFGARRQP